MSFEAKDYPISDILNKVVFDIPRNQRRYVWKKSSWQDLFEDVLFSITEEKPHFIGSIVLKKGSKKDGLSYYTIIDGQQRITTITLFLVAIMKHFHENDMMDDFWGTVSYLQSKDNRNQDMVILNSEFHTSISHIIAGMINIKDPKMSINAFVDTHILSKSRDNSIMNRIIKSTVELLLRSNISKQRKKNLRKLMVYFSEVDFIDLYTVNWNVQYNRNNQTYHMLISICYLVVKGLLQTQSNGHTELMDFLDEQRMCRLYEKFILEYYRKEFKNQFTANASQIPWQLDNEENSMLPVMQSDIMLQSGEKVLIIDAKYYEHSTQVQFDKHTLHSGNLYQIFTYVKNKEYELREKDHTVSGMLLYAKTDEEIYPNNVYQMSGNQITVRTLDLNLPFDEIAGQLNTIAKTHFDL